MNQKDAVYEAIKHVKGDRLDPHKPVTLSKTEKEAVRDQLFQGFKAGKIQYNKDAPSDDKLLMYVNGLVSNWLRKDPRLNGDKKYTPKNPGARAATLPPGFQLNAGNLTPEQLEHIRALTGGGAAQVIIVQPAATVMKEAPELEPMEPE